MSPRKLYGGQAVIEGVMMRGRSHYAVACRRANGEIVVKEEAVPALFTRFAWARWPFFRGVFALFDTLVLGLMALRYSADLALQDEEDAAKPAGEEGDAAAADAPRNGASGQRKRPETVTGLAIAGSMVVGLGMGIFLFVLLPHAVAQLLSRVVESPLALNLVEGVLRVAIVLAYIIAIGRMKRIQRIFQYHGAEHMAINAWERERSLEVDAAARQSRLHPRCGTNFLLTVVLVKLIVYPLFGWHDPLTGFALRLALLPVVASVAFEVIRLAGLYRNFRPLQWLVAPGVLTQNLTTRPPDAEILEVALRSLRSVIEREEPAAAEST